MEHTSEFTFKRFEKGGNRCHIMYQGTPIAECPIVHFERGSARAYDRIHLLDKKKVDGLTADQKRAFSSITKTWSKIGIHDDQGPIGSVTACQRSSKQASFTFEELEDLLISELDDASFEKIASKLTEINELKLAKTQLARKKKEIESLNIWQLQELADLIARQMSK